MAETLYDKNFEKASCGFGLIAQMDNIASHWLVKTSIESLSRLAHRGAVAADGKTGDGCGILMSIPRPFFKKLAQENEIELNDDFAVASIFLDNNKLTASNSLAWLKKELKYEGFKVAWEREVPINTEACGQNALETLPTIMQVFINCPERYDEATIERKLYIARRKTELSLENKDPNFYIASLSSKLISYKGMVMPHNLPVFFPDLADENFESTLCLYHQRFSTNTMPQWKLAQPFRMLAHNGEINTIRGNRNWSISRESKYATALIPEFDQLLPIVNKEGSDSMSLDNMVEGLVMTGKDLLHAIKVLIPPAWQNNESLDPDLRAFYEYHSLHVDTWDGPAGLVLTDGRYAACSMDRNGLRPARYVITKDRHFTVASEIGVYNYKPEEVLTKGRLKPGEIIALDLKENILLKTEDIDNEFASRYPYKEWLDQQSRYFKPIFAEEKPGCDPVFEHELDIYQKQYGLSTEEKNNVLKALAQNSQELLVSMGDDTPLAVLSKEVRPLYEYFRQQFAQVTNPPIDPIRESLVMSLQTSLGAEKNPFEASQEAALRIDIDSPVLSRSLFKSLLQPDDPNFAYETIDLTYPAESDLQTALMKICNKAERAARNGKVFLILTDRRVKSYRIPVHALLATGAVQARLNEHGLRCNVNIIVETATARDPHHFACLIGFGATAVYPFFAYQMIHHMAEKGQIECDDTVDLMVDYRKGIKKGLCKILSKMGISTINSYRGAQLFEAIGLHDEVIETCFPGTPSRIQGASFEDLEKDMRSLSKDAWDTEEKAKVGGLIRFHPRGEFHAINPAVIKALQHSVKTGDYEDYKIYADLTNNRPFTSLRDLLGLKQAENKVDINSVEPIENIMPRFATAAMSLGAISAEAHEAIAIAMNKIGGKSNSGEGGEDPLRYGTESNSKIKQIASGRFGVTAEYLVNAEELQIKVAQGAKPGEGGQLPGNKVNAMIATLRYTKPGISLISPPPHHDIYSIEDLAQLIFDLKQVNPDAMVTVKLVAESGIGTIAAGVAKTYADGIVVSGHDGGTGASPLSSVRYAGIPWEIGLAETHQTLRATDLRSKVKVQADGGMKTGLDVVKAALLGAETYGFGTIPLIALGCKYLRICHLNTCPTGVATQDRDLIDKYYTGLSDHVINYFKFIAQEIREYLSYLGYESLDEIIGKTELLELLPGETDKQKSLSLEVLKTIPEEAEGKPNYCLEDNPPFDKAVLANKMLEESIDAIKNKTGGSFEYHIQNIDRSIGARVSGEIAKLHGNQEMNDHPIEFKFNGTAGQSFGVWNVGGLHMKLEGDANDYVGKGMTGGQISIFPPANSAFINSRAPSNCPIIGNTCLYGATGGRLFAAGIAGERFAVRNSGAIAVLEGLGDHGCEYMTGGVVVVLGQIGLNFGAGMTGGMAFVFDLKNELDKKMNHELVERISMNGEALKEQAYYLKVLIQEFVTETKSKWGECLLHDFESYLQYFSLVKPKAIDLESLSDFKNKQEFDFPLEVNN